MVQLDVNCEDHMLVVLYTIIVRKFKKLDTLYPYKNKIKYENFSV